MFLRAHVYDQRQPRVLGDESPIKQQEKLTRNSLGAASRSTTDSTRFLNFPSFEALLNTNSFLRCSESGFDDARPSPSFHSRSSSVSRRPRLETVTEQRTRQSLAQLGKPLYEDEEPVHVLQTGSIFLQEFTGEVVWIFSPVLIVRRSFFFILERKPTQIRG